MTTPNDEKLRELAEALLGGNVQVVRLYLEGEAHHPTYHRNTVLDLLVKRLAAADLVPRVELTPQLKDNIERTMGIWQSWTDDDWMKGVDMSDEIASCQAILDAGKGD